MKEQIPKKEPTKEDRRNISRKIESLQKKEKKEKWDKTKVKRIKNEKIPNKVETEELREEEENK